MAMKKSRALAAASSVWVAAMCLCAHGSPPTGVSPATEEAGAPRKVSISNFTFSPATLEVPAGTQLLFVNEDDVPHTVLGSDKDSPLRSPALDTDGRYSVVLSQPGTYRYFCSLHPHMTGTVIVK